MLDVVIVGGGAAGLSAALTLGRVRRSTLLVDAGEPRNAPSPAVHNFFTRDGTPPAELYAIARAQLAEYPTVEVRDACVESIRRREDGTFEFSLSGSEEVEARAILFATGLVDEMPVDGLDALWGRSVLHCPYCHGYEARDTPLAVLGATPDRVRIALLLTRLSADVALLANGAEPPDPDAWGLLRARGVAVREEPVAHVERDGEAGVRIVFGDGSALARGALFVKSRTRQRSLLPARLGCGLLDDDTVEVDDFGRTSVPGVYAVGDMARRPSMPAPTASVVAAAASGAIAASTLDQELVCREFGLPSPFPAWKA